MSKTDALAMHCPSHTGRCVSMSSPLLPSGHYKQCRSAVLCCWGSVQRHVTGVNRPDRFTADTRFYQYVYFGLDLSPPTSLVRFFFCPSYSRSVLFHQSTWRGRELTQRFQTEEGQSAFYSYLRSIQLLVHLPCFCPLCSPFFCPFLLSASSWTVFSSCTLF